MGDDREQGLRVSIIESDSDKEYNVGVYLWGSRDPQSSLMRRARPVFIAQQNKKDEKVESPRQSENN